jgi:hypothetical protein
MRPEWTFSRHYIGLNPNSDSRSRLRHTIPNEEKNNTPIDDFASIQAKNFFTKLTGKATYKIEKHMLKSYEKASEDYYKKIPYSHLESAGKAIDEEIARRQPKTSLDKYLKNKHGYFEP